MLMSKKLLLKSLVVLGLLVTGGNAFAQNASADKGNSFFLNLRGDIGGTTFVEKSSVPYSVTGFTSGVQGGFTDEWKRCHIQLDLGWMPTLTVDPMGTTNRFNTKLEFMYSCLNPSIERWHFWSGASVGGFVDLKVLSDLQNAQTSLTFFGDVSLEEQLQVDFAYDKKDASHPWLTAALQISLPLYAYGSHPGFAYVQPPLNDDDVMTLLAGKNEPVSKWFPGYSYDIGLIVNLRNGNRFAFGHRVDFFSTGKQGTYRYDNACRTGYIKFMFKI